MQSACRTCASTPSSPVASPQPQNAVTPRPVSFQRAFGNHAVARAAAEEAEAERTAERVMSGDKGGCACGGNSDEERDRDGLIPAAVQQVVASPGHPLDSSTSTLMSSRFGRDFGAVRLHTDAAAAASARAVAARAYTVGQDIAFGAGQYRPGTGEGQRLIAHELQHTVQQRGGGVALRRAAIAAAEPDEPETVAQETPLRSESPLPQPVVAPRPASPTTTAIPAPETCPPPADLACTAATDSPAAVTDTLVFPRDSSTLDSTQVMEIDATAAAWRVAGGSIRVRVDGYASAEGACDYNWRLSCRRVQAIVNELEHPTDGTAGVPAGVIDGFAHGETDEASRARLAPNRMGTISIPVPLPPPPPPPVPTPACPLPRSLGVGRVCDPTADDIQHFDFPSISLASELKLTAWALGHLPPTPTRWLVPDTDCLAEMAAVLSGLGRSAGVAAFTHFVAGSGAPVTHGPASTLGALALVAPSFLATVAAVRTNIESQLAAQASSGALDPCALSVTPPATFFSFSDGAPLKAVIGGTQGEELTATSFSGSISTRTYSIGLRFVICDHFGVDESDLYAPGLFGFWVLQHERNPALYTPFVNTLDLPVTLSGTF